MSFPTKVQVIKRKKSEQWYINFPSAVAQMMDFSKGEVVRWSLHDRSTLVLDVQDQVAVASQAQGHQEVGGLVRLVGQRQARLAYAQRKEDQERRQAEQDEGGDAFVGLVHEERVCPGLLDRSTFRRGDRIAKEGEELRSEASPENVDHGTESQQRDGETKLQIREREVDQDEY